MADTLQELQQKISLKSGLESKFRELENQRITYDRNVLSLQVALRKEQEDVEKLEGRSLANYFYQVIGKLDEKLDEERKEAYAAQVKLDAAKYELAGIEKDIQKIREQLCDIGIAEAKFVKEMEQKRAALQGTASGAEILELEQNIAVLEARKVEIREAIAAGNKARQIADRILGELDSAEGWNTWDLLGGGGIITHAAKHAHLDDAQDLISALQSQLRRFKTELADIQITVDTQISIDGFLRFADYFFDGLFADLAVGDSIKQSMYSVKETKRKIQRTLDELKELEKGTEAEILTMKQKLEDCVIRS